MNVSVFKPEIDSVPHGLTLPIALQVFEVSNQTLLVYTASACFSASVDLCPFGLMLRALNVNPSGHHRDGCMCYGRMVLKVHMGTTEFIKKS